MKYLYVWLTIGMAQLVFLVLVAMLHHIGSARSATVGRVDVQGEGAARSWFWWRRLAAARRLSAVAKSEDREVIQRLLADSHPGVQGAATASLLRYADDALLSLVIDGLTSRSTAVRRYQISVLRERSALVAPLLLARLDATTAPDRLQSYIDLVESLDSPQCMEVVAALSIHQHPDVRFAVAKVLRRLNDESAVIKLLTMLRDPDWRVRAQAARSLGSVGDQRAVPELVRAMTDRNWWVRFRAGLALATIGNLGREALQSTEGFPDRYARDMAAFVSGLSESSIAELSEG